MTKNEFKTFCTTTPTGATLTLSCHNVEVEGKFIGCADGAIIIEANGCENICPLELCDYYKTSYPPPSYS
jgi:hypothetical protein